MLMMDQWEGYKEVDVSSAEEAYDSDQISSDVEAELYSVIHHEIDQSTSNFYDSSISSNTSDKENKSISWRGECRIFNNSCQIFSNNNLTILEESCMSYQHSSFKRKSNSDCVTLDESIQGSSKKQKGNIIANNINVKFNETVVVSTSCDEDDNDIVRLQQPIKNIYSSSDDNDVVHLRQPEKDILSSDDDNDIVRLEQPEKNIFSSDDDNNVVRLQPEKDIFSSSDDNDIICIEPSDKQNCIETNVSEIIITDSDSDTVDSWCFNSSTNNTSTPSSSKNKDLWFVNTEDLYRSRRSSNRYHESQLTCDRCNQRGHSSKFCSFNRGPKCFICGGNHGIYRCRNRICAKCLGWGHDIRNCPKGVDVCALCQMPGHNDNSCPDLWRRFQRTTGKKTKKIWRLFQDTPYFCYNCGLSGHFGAICKNRRMNVPCFPTWPFVLNYKVQGKAKSKMVPMFNIPNNNESFTGIGQQGQVPKQKKKKKKMKKNLPGGVNQQQISFPRTPKNNNQSDTITNITIGSPNDNNNSKISPRKPKMNNQTSPKTYGPLNLNWREYKQKSKRAKKLRQRREKRKQLQQEAKIKTEVS